MAMAEWKVNLINSVTGALACTAIEVMWLVL